MSTYYSTHRKFGIYLLVLVHLLAALLPVSARPVAAQAPGCGETGSLATSAAAVAVASADEDATIPKETVDFTIHLANWREKLTDAKKVESLVLDYFLMYTHKVSFDKGDPFTKWQDGYSFRLGALSPDDQDHLEFVLEAMLDIALTIPEMAPIVPFVWRDLTENGITSSGLDLNFDIRIGQTAQHYRLTDMLLLTSAETIERVYKCAKEIPAVAEAYNKFHKELLNAEIGDSAKEVMAKNPGLSIPTPIRDGIAEDGTVSISLNDLKALSQAEFDKIHTTLDDILVTVKDIDERQKVITDYLANQVEKEKAQELAKKKAAEYQLKLDAAKSSIFIISTIASQIDPKVGKHIAVYGNAAITVGDSLVKWVKATAGLKTLDKVASLSTVVLTGNVLGAVMSVVSLFAPDQPKPEQMILDEIGKLRQQVDQLRTEMHDRFDRIDQGLNAIYTTMHERFDQIDIQLGKINGNIQQVQQSLVELDLQLSRIERNNFELLNTLGRRPFLEAINGGLGYEERTGQPMPFRPEFVAFENVLHSWATIHAFDPLNAGPTQRDFRDAKLMDELAAYPLDANLNYLNGWLKANGLPGIADKPLPSPRDWLFASRAYTQLGLENPEHMKAIDPQRQARLNEIGVELETAMAKLSTQLTAAGPLGNSLLFSTVITQYQGKLDSLDNSIQALESAFMSEVRQNLQRSEPFDLYGGLDQRLSYLTPEVTTATCGNREGHGSHPAPANLRSLIPNFDRYNLAEYLRLGKLPVCISDLWYDLEEICTEFDPERPNDPPFCYYTKARHISYVTVFFDSVPLASFSIDEGEMSVPPSGPDEKFTRKHWNIYKAKFEALTAADAPTPEVEAQRAAVTAKLEAALGNYQQTLYGRALNEMNQGALKPLATELGGSKALLDAFTTLGLPRAVQSDEFLHALLYGNQQLVGDSEIRQSFALSATHPITGTNLLVNPRLVMKQAADERAEVFSELVVDYLAAITAKSHVETPDYIASTRRMLDLTMRIARIELPQEPGEEAIAGLQASNDSPTLLGNATAFSASVSKGSNVSFAWDFGDGGTGVGASPTHTYAAAGSYTARVKASNTINQETVEIQVVVTSQPGEEAITGLQASNDSPTLLGNATAFSASVSKGSNVSFAWDFGDGSAGIGASTSHSYAEAGAYVVRVTASNSLGQRTAELAVQVHAPDPAAQPIAGLQATHDGPTVLGEATQFAARVEVGTNVSYAWTFGDGKVGAGANPTHTYDQAGTYLVRVIASNSVNQSTKELVVQVHAPNPTETPVAGLTATHDGPTVLGEMTSFVARVTAGTNVSFAWDFGDGKVGAGANPSHRYDEPGVFVVRVTSSNSVSQETVTLQVVITPTATGEAPHFVFLPAIHR